VERSGQHEFDFEYDDDFAWHIDEFAPTFCKVLVRYGPEGEGAMNQRQADRLRLLSDHLHREGRKFMFDLRVPGGRTKRDRLAEANVFDRRWCPDRALHAIRELQEAGVEPDVWQIEGLDRREDCARVVAAARRGGRRQVGCIMRSEGGDAVVERSLALTARVPGFIGFAVGRPTFWEPLTRWQRGRLSREAVVAEITQRFLRWCRIFCESVIGGHR
jgi:myo-inositol catabolism protein IolC